jgi:hypothetical protein
MIEYGRSRVVERGEQPFRRQFGTRPSFERGKAPMRPRVTSVVTPKLGDLKMIGASKLPTIPHGCCQRRSLNYRCGSRCVENRIVKGLAMGNSRE